MLKTFTEKQIKESRAAALAKVREYLDAGDIENQFAGRNGDYWSSNKFIVTWHGHHHTMAAEFSLCKTDSFYRSYSGYAAIYTTQGLFHQHQFDGYPSIEHGLIAVGLLLCAGRPAKAEFFEKYAKPYNERVEAQRKEKAKA